MEVVVEEERLLGAADPGPELGCCSCKATRGSGLAARGRAPRVEVVVVVVLEEVAVVVLEEAGILAPCSAGGSIQPEAGVAAAAGAGVAAAAAGGGGGDGGGDDDGGDSCSLRRRAANIPRKEGIWARCSWSLSKTNSWSLICEVQKY